MRKWCRHLVDIISIEEKLNVLQETGHTVFSITPYHFWQPSGKIELMIVCYKDDPSNALPQTEEKAAPGYPLNNK